MKFEDQLELVPITYDISRLKPVISEKSFDLHYNTIYFNHVNDFNKGKGDIPFNKAGAHLHGLFFGNLREYRKDNTPTGRIAQIIATRYGTYENFVTTLLEQGSRIQGNGWLFMNNAGYINIIPNNRIVDNIAMIIDVWEHAYLFDFGNDKTQYLKQFLHLINWDVVNQRLVDIANKKKEK